MMKRILSFILAGLMMAAVLCGCKKNEKTNSGDSESQKSETKESDAQKSENTDAGNNNGEDGDDVSSSLPALYEITETDPHYLISIPEWHAENYGCGFALTESGNNKYAIVAAYDYSAEEAPLKDAFSALYNDNFNGVLMQNYRAKYAQLELETTETKLADGSAALLFEGVQKAEDYGTELSCPIYGYGFSHDGVPFIMAYIVMDESAADDAKRDEMKYYVDEMVNTVRTAK